MSGRASTDINTPLWPTDGNSTHGRRSLSSYRPPNNNALFSPYGEENVGLQDLAETAEGDELFDEDRERRKMSMSKNHQTDSDRR